MARKRDYAAEYRARQAKARRLGYTSYYARRVRQGAPPSAPKPTGELLRRLRGHASAADLERLLKSGRVSVLNQELVGGRDAKGRIKEVQVRVQLTDGTQRRFRLRGAQLREPELGRLQSAAVEAGRDIYTMYDFLGIIREADEAA